jgi:endonuclease/exonuclease/phosphatase family metal-dependent hydrolase
MNIKIIAYNIACAQWCMTEQLANELKTSDADVMLLSEVPRLDAGTTGKEWIEDLADKLGFQHCFIGTISSANHQSPDWPALTGKHGGKYKAILSKTPLMNCCDLDLNGDGWSPASAVRADTIIAGVTITLYALHIPGIHDWEKSTHRHLATEIVNYRSGKNAIAGGDFNEFGNSEVMMQMIENTHLLNAVTKESIDHMLYDDQHNLKFISSGEAWGPQIAESSPKGYLSDHPYIWADFVVKE